MKALAGMITLSAAFLAGCELGKLETAKNAVADRLRDPDSAQFRGLKDGERNGMYTVCGEVNGKNAYGAYTGYERFVASNGGKAVYLESQWPTFEVRWITDCPR